MITIQKSVLIQKMNDRPKDSSDFENLVVSDVSIDPIDGRLCIFVDNHGGDSILARDFIESFENEFHGKYYKLT